MELTTSDIKDALNLTQQELEQVFAQIDSAKALVIDNALVYTSKRVLPIGNVLVNGKLIYLGYLIVDNQVCNKFMLSKQLPKPSTTYTVHKDIIDGVEAITDERLLSMLNITLKAI